MKVRKFAGLNKAISLIIRVQGSAKPHELVSDNDKKAVRVEVAALWMDTNPIFSLLSQVLPYFLQEIGLLGINSDRFETRIQKEAGLPASTNSTKVLKAVFSATKEELPHETIESVSQWLPGYIKELWQAV